MAYAKLLAMSKTHAYLLIEERLKEPLDGWVMKARDEGQSWFRIARELDYATRVPVTPASVQNWFDAADKARQAKAGKQPAA